MKGEKTGHEERKRSKRVQRGTIRQRHTKHKRSIVREERTQGKETQRTLFSQHILVNLVKPFVFFVVISNFLMID